MTDDNTQEEYGQPEKPTRRRNPFLIILLILLGLLLLVVFEVQRGVGVANVFSFASNFIVAPMNKLDSRGGRTNILVMGKAGGSHEGPDLTDTMLLVSVGLDKPDITTVSLPRDLWIPEIRAKINSAYFWGKNGSPYLDVSEMGGGISFSKIIAGEVVGFPIQYGVVVDFSAFKDIIDALGGIKVDVTNSFTDKLYPIAGKENDTCGGDLTFACRYETVSFKAGPELMNGDTALIFVRSRHAEGIEGTDEAREARQQKVIDAIRNKITDPTIFLSLKTDLTMIGIFKKYVETDISTPAAAVLARVVLRDYKNVNQYLIPVDLLVNPPISKTYDKQYVFIPKAGNGRWSEIQTWVSSVFSSN